MHGRRGYEVVPSETVDVDMTGLSLACGIYRCAVISIAIANGHIASLTQSDALFAVHEGQSCWKLWLPDLEYTLHLLICAGPSARTQLEISTLLLYRAVACVGFAGG